MRGLTLGHKKLDVWKAAVKFVAEVYRLTAQLPKEEIYGLTSQLRRAAVSVPSNIAEGAARKSSKERTRFYEIARSSLVEVDTQLELCIQLGYLQRESLPDLDRQSNHLFAMLSNVIKSTKALD